MARLPGPIARRVAAVAGFAVLPAVGWAGPAWSQWSVAGGGPARGGARTMVAPQGVTAACTSLLSSTVTVSWSTAALAAGYTVEQQIGSGSWTSAGSTASTSMTVSIAGLVGVGVRYRVTGTVHSWQSAPSTATTPVLTSSLGLCLG